MGQKVNPTGLRIGVIKDWNSRWFVKDSEFGDTIASDYKLRAYPHPLCEARPGHW